MWSWNRSAQKTKAEMVPEVVAYAVGDVHGSARLLRAMIARLLADSALHVGKRATIVFLGDYVDKGDDSRGVIEELMRAKVDPRADWVMLKGNHEDALLTFLRRPDYGPQWMSIGGAQTLNSYGVLAPPRGAEPGLWATAAATLRRAMGARHLSFLQSLPTSHRLGGYFFAHAGVRPGVDLDAQDDNDLMWIRGPFLKDKAPLPAVVVHGHSPDLEPYRDYRRIGVDTGAYATGRLTAVRLLGAQAALVTVSTADLEAPPALKAG
jgi:serine/threonine protein phosphatase 1